MSSNQLPAVLSPVPPVRRVKYGWQPDLPDRRDRKYSAPLRVLTRLPERVDLRNEWMPPVYDQGEVGSCSTNAIGALCEYLMRRDPGVVPDVFRPSRLFMYYNAREIENSVSEDCGCQLRDVIASLGVHGFCPEDQWPYDEGRWSDKPPSQCYEDAARQVVTVAAKIQPSLTQLQACLAEGFPIAFGFAVYESIESDEVRRTGVVDLPAINERCFGGHAVLLVGYDNETRRFVVRNSWGESWGDRGYGYFPYEFLLDQECADDYWTIRAVP